MAVVQEYIGWATNVNRIILDSTTISMGENATRSDEMESGYKRTVQKNAFCPDKFSVKMSFDWVNKIEGTNKTEYQLFTDWYKYRHKYGAVPFEFPEILYSADTGIWINDSDLNSSYAVEYYKITSAVESAKSGEHVEVTMTWETVYGGVVSIETPLPQVIGIEATVEHMDIFFSAVSDTAPVAQDFIVYINSQLTTPSGFHYDGQRTVRIFYQLQPELHGTATVAISYAGLSVPAGTYVSTF